MSMTLYEASKLSRNPLTRGVMQAIATTDQLLAITPMVNKKGESWKFNREKALPSVEFVADNHTSLTESSATFDEVRVPKRLIVSDVDVYNFAEEEQDDTNQQTATQLEKKLKALGRQLGNTNITGGFASSFTISAAIAGVTPSTPGPQQDSTRWGPGHIFYDQSADEMFYRGPGDRALGPAVDVSSNGTFTLVSDNPNKWIKVVIVTASLPAGDAWSVVQFVTATNEYDGLLSLIPSGQVIASGAANGDQLTFEKLDEMIDEKVKVRDNLAFIMPGKLKRKFYSLVRALGGTDPQSITMEGITGQVPTYRGIPILQNDWIPATESKGSASTLSSILLLSISAEEGFYMGVGGAGESQVLDGDPREFRVLGVKVRMIGELEDKEAERTRVSWYGAGTLGSELAAARCSEIITAA